MRRDVLQRLDHRALDARMLALEIHQQALDTLALQAEVTAGGTAASDDGKSAFLRVRPSFFFADVDEWPDHDVGTVV